ncbi:MAG: hypothetical protein JKY53_14905 [Flavobacteriales bacterium]|nr:hypothetical protein [Flavobacteriales bacterium]
MPAGETILKLTDYPFSYSIIGIISGVLGFGIADNQLIFLGIAGAFGTFLTVVDPMGWLLRVNAKDRIKKGLDQSKNSSQTLEKEYKISALKSKSINFEIEKIFGLFYFIIILTAFLIAMGFSESLFEKLIIKDSNNVAIFPMQYFQLGYIGLTLVALGALIGKAIHFWKDLDSKIMVAGFHQIAINNDNATQTSVENMSRAVEQNDWALAKIWESKIKEEIKYKKGKRELIIKAADTVFSPLHFEASEFQKYLQDRKRDPFKDFKTDQWMKIKQNSHQSIVEDTKLRHRIEDFYNTINDYNKIVPNLFSTLNEIIKKNFSEIFGENVDSVEIHLDIPNSGSTVHLPTCGLFGFHPLEFESSLRKFGSFKMHIRSEGNQLRHAEFKQQEDFDKVWRLVLNEIKHDDLIVKMNEYLKSLEIENNKLMKIYSEKIEMQWMV